MHNKMVKVDLKDKKILYELKYDSRQSLSQIGKKVGLHKNVVLYRIKRLKRLINMVILRRRNRQFWFQNLVVKLNLSMFMNMMQNIPGVLL